MNARRLGTGFAALGGLALAAGVVASDWTGAPACREPWVFFDLGNTVVIHRAGTPSSYAPGAREYLRELKRRGYRVGLITNVPTEWGSTSHAKIRELKKVLSETWSRDPAAAPMAWEDFAESRTFVPAREEDRKPSPYLFRSALAHVSLEEGASDCRVFFQGEDPREVEAARREGMIAHLVGRDPAAPFLPVDEIERLARE